MSMTLEQMLDALPPGRREAVERHGAELIAREMTLRELRQAMGKTQTEVARLTGKPQASISRMKAQSDMLLSTLNQMVSAIGGRVRIVAELPGHQAVELTGFGDLTEAP